MIKNGTEGALGCYARRWGANDELFDGRCGGDRAAHGSRDGIVIQAQPVGRGRMSMAAVKVPTFAGRNGRGRSLERRTSGDERREQGMTSILSAGLDRMPKQVARQLRTRRVGRTCSRRTRYPRRSARAGEASCVAATFLGAACL